MVFFIFLQILIEHSANSATSDLGLHCLHMSHKKDARLIGVKSLARLRCCNAYSI